MPAFNNPLKIPADVILLRLQALNQRVDVRFRNEQGRHVVLYVRVPVGEEHIPESELEKILSKPASKDELAVVSAMLSAREEFKSMPGWADWTADQALDYINDNVTTLAEAKDVLTNMANAIIYFRNLLIR